jgi:hypothetical protein
MPGVSRDFNHDYDSDFGGGVGSPLPIVSQDFNHDYNFDFAGGFVGPTPPSVISQDFNYDYNSDFAGGFVPGIIIPPPPPPPPPPPDLTQSFPSEYIAVPANLLIQVRAEYRTIKIQPEGW